VEATLPVCVLFSPKGSLRLSRVRDRLKAYDAVVASRDIVWDMLDERSMSGLSSSGNRLWKLLAYLPVNSRLTDGETPVIARLGPT